MGCFEFLLVMGGLMNECGGSPLVVSNSFRIFERGFLQNFEVEYCRRFLSSVCNLGSCKDGIFGYQSR